MFIFLTDHLILEYRRDRPCPLHIHAIKLEPQRAFRYVLHLLESSHEARIFIVHLLTPKTVTSSNKTVLGYINRGTPSWEQFLCSQRGLGVASGFRCIFAAGTR